MLLILVSMQYIPMQIYSLLNTYFTNFLKGKRLFVIISDHRRSLGGIVYISWNIRFRSCKVVPKSINLRFPVCWHWKTERSQSPPGTFHASSITNTDCNTQYHIPRTRYLEIVCNIVNKMTLKFLSPILYFCNRSGWFSTEPVIIVYR